MQDPISEVKSRIRAHYLKHSGDAETLAKIFNRYPGFDRDVIREAVRQLVEYEILTPSPRGHGETQRFSISREYLKEMSGRPRK